MMREEQTCAVPLHWQLANLSWVDSIVICKNFKVSSDYMSRCFTPRLKPTQFLSNSINTSQIYAMLSFLESTNNSDFVHARRVMEIIENKKGGTKLRFGGYMYTFEKVDTECCCARDSLSVVSETGYVNENWIGCNKNASGLDISLH